MPHHSHEAAEETWRHHHKFYDGVALLFVLLRAADGEVWNQWRQQTSQLNAIEQRLLQGRPLDAKSQAFLHSLDDRSP